ncbi:hypothetical protein ACSSNL_08485 [Thalassobius sp. S69A]|uniref:hypothetical protein n=1 Tax=unclassified Thalassovita TaxID=2619711 RepID=UPI000C0E6EB4|nr:hypothetical protein [Paracoccaceae bacterium]MBT26375.1 hypothetical protein [Paracoccaceae bacterium]
MPKMQTAQPARKVYGSTAAAAFASVLILLVERMSAAPLPDGLDTAIMTLVVFAAGYFIPPAAIDQVIETPLRTGDT